MWWLHSSTVPYAVGRWWQWLLPEEETVEMTLMGKEGKYHSLFIQPRRKVLGNVRTVVREEHVTRGSLDCNGIFPREMGVLLLVI